MQTVAASVILDDAYRLIGWDADQLDTREKGDARMALSLALQELWEEWWWDELMVCVKRQCARTYSSATTYAAGDFVYFPATDKYYQCLQAATGEDPEEWDGNNYDLNASYWIEAAATWEGEDYNDIDSPAALEAGDVVRYTDGNYYAWLGNSVTNAMLVASAGAAFINGTYDYTGQVNGRNAYARTTQTIQWNGSQWIIEAAGLTYYSSSDDVATPDLVTTWTGSPSPLPTVTSTEGTVPTPETAGYWCPLTEFHPTLPYTVAGTDYETVADVRKIARFDPRCTATPDEFDFHLTADGVRICDLDLGRPWVWSRRPTPVLTGAPFDEDTDYEATDPQDLVFDS